MNSPTLFFFLRLILSRVLQLALTSLACGVVLAPLGAFGAEPYSWRQAPPPPKDAPYVLGDGSIYIAGNGQERGLVEKYNDAFARAHPGFKFKVETLNSSVGTTAVIAGRAAYGIAGRDITKPDQDAFLARWGYPMTDIRIGWCNTPDADHFPPGKSPPGVWVNAKNPVPSLTVQEVMAIFMAGSATGDITHWGQISNDEGPVGANGGDWSKRIIHVYLPSLRGLPIISSTRSKMEGLSWTRRAEYLPMIEDVINAVANDEFGVGFIGWWPTDAGWDRQAELGSKVRLLPIAASKTARISHGGVGDLYPFAGGIHILLNRPPGAKLDPWLEDYVRFVLSSEGQGIIASITQTEGFIPLSSADTQAEAAKLD